MLKKNKLTKLFPLLIITSSIFLVGMKKLDITPKEVYHVYLGGKSIGLVKSKVALEEYIDKEQESLKEKYNVKRVYAPDNLDIKKEIKRPNEPTKSKTKHKKRKKKKTHLF